MFSSLRVPERLFQLAGWAVSFVFASFLIGLGGKVVADLPGVEQRVPLEQFVDSTRAATLRARADSLRRAQQDASAARERAGLALTASSNAYRAAREGFENWVSTRTATTDPRQDPEVVARTRQLDQLKEAERAAQREVERLDAAQLAATQALERTDAEDAALREGGRAAWERATFVQELRVFGIRLALTLPLLVLAGWIVARKRKSEYWPLLRGVVVFALVAFFVELVPYLPSYGGYVRDAVGVVATGIAGIWVIRAMRRYLARRAEAAAQSEGERRQRLGYEEALRRMQTGVCPGCERAIAGLGPAGAAVAGSAAPSNFCVHCGMRLFDACGGCGTRKNAFFPFCPTCGVPADRPPAGPHVPNADRPGAPPAGGAPGPSLTPAPA